MRYAVLALAACGTMIATVAQAQYYPPPGYSGYYDGPGPSYRPAPPGYYGPPGGYGPPGYPVPRHYRYNYGDAGSPLGAPVRATPRDPGYEPWRPRRDPRNGGYYCVQAGFTVQDGVCKPGRPY
jgi:hypothetical protein